MKGLQDICGNCGGNSVAAIHPWHHGEIETSTIHLTLVLLVTCDKRRGHMHVWIIMAVYEKGYVDRNMACESFLCHSCCTVSGDF